MGCWLCGDMAVVQMYQTWAECPACVGGSERDVYLATDPSCVERDCGDMRMCNLGDGTVRVEHPGEACLVLDWSQGIHAASWAYREWLARLHLYQDGVLPALSELLQVDQYRST